MKPYFISDLDRTLIFAGYPEQKVVEYIGERKITYMTPKSYDLMQEVLHKTTFIPCTMRNLHQTDRVQFIRDYAPQYMICTNGAEIFIDGELDMEWDKIVRESVSKEEINNLHAFVETLDLDLVENRNVNEFYLALKFRTKDLDKEIALLKKVIPSTYNIQQSDFKVFLLPKAINKANAIDYLREKYQFEDIYVAGDSEADRKMTLLPYVKAYVPAHATFEAPNAFRTEAEDIESTEELLEHLLSRLE